jgi:hypothetical protein
LAGAEDRVLSFGLCRGIFPKRTFNLSRYLDYLLMGHLPPFSFLNFLLSHMDALSKTGKLGEGEKLCSENEEENKF